MSPVRHIAFSASVIAEWGGSLPQLQSESEDAQLFAEWKQELRKASGIPRSRSAAVVTCSTAILLRRFLSESGIAGRDVGLIVASTSSAVGVAYDFERTGTREGWDLVDPFALPNAIPSAAATQPALATGAQAFALTVLDQRAAGILALEIAAVLLQAERASAILVVCGEEFPLVQATAATACSVSAPWSIGTSALRLVRRRGKRGDVALAFAVRGTNENLSPDWRDAPCVTFGVAELPPDSLSALNQWPEMASEHNRFVFSTDLPGGDSLMIGFEVLC